ncbi:MAG: CPBP family glutamic-type intramembrane protease [Kofleriaceae bacterium]
MKRARAGWAGHGDLAASLTLVLPLWLIYGVAAALAMRLSDVDLASRALWIVCGRDRDRFLLAYALCAAGYLWWLRRHPRAGSLRLAVVVPLLVEAAVYAATLVTVVAAVVARLPGLGAVTVVAAVGAGLHEELVFRLLGVGGGAALGRRLGLSPRAAVIVAAVGSSLVFAAAHHLAGEPWDGRAFGFRTASGLVFATVFWQRSLAHAVYAHTLYDLWIAVGPR